MNAKPSPTQRAHARFFLRVGKAGRGPWRDENTLPLFSLPLIMDAEGILSDDAKHLVERR